MSEVDFDLELQHCRERLGEAPRRFSLLDRIRYLRIGKPGWAYADELKRFFELRARLLECGRVTWAHLIQAKRLLFAPGRYDHPGELVYASDPSRPVALATLARVASELFSLKGTQQSDPKFAEISRYLGEETIRVFGLAVPQLVSHGAPCAVSTTFFARKHLPGGILSSSSFPILVLDEKPTAAMVIPSRFWSASLVDHWMSDAILPTDSRDDGVTERPELIAINHDDYHAEHVGHTEDGRQFFLTNPFEPAAGDQRGAEYVALFLFDRRGNLLEAKVDDFGPRAAVDEDKRRRVYEGRLSELGAVVFDRIEVKPFVVERFGTQFGLIPREPEDDDDRWAVEMMPGNYMAFFEPWDSGEYDT